MIKQVGIVALVNDLWYYTPREREDIATMLSGIAADIHKGAAGDSSTWKVLIESE